MTHGTQFEECMTVKSVLLWPPPTLISQNFPSPYFEMFYDTTNLLFLQGNNTARAM